MFMLKACSFREFNYQFDFNNCKFCTSIIYKKIIKNLLDSSKIVIFTNNNFWDKNLITIPVNIGVVFKFKQIKYN